MASMLNKPVSSRPISLSAASSSARERVSWKRRAFSSACESWSVTCLTSNCSFWSQLRPAVSSTTWSVAQLRLSIWKASDMLDGVSAPPRRAMDTDSKGGSVPVCVSAGARDTGLVAAGWAELTAGFFSTGREGVFRADFSLAPCGLSRTTSSRRCPESLAGCFFGRAGVDGLADSSCMPSKRSSSRLLVGFFGIFH